MYLLSDFFIATPAELVAFDRTKSPVLCFPTVLGRGADHKELLDLFRLVADGRYLPESLPADGEDLALDDAGSSCLLRVPPVVVENLGLADDDQLAEWAAAWASTKMWLDDGFPPAKLPFLMKDLAKLARQAEATGSSMYVWIFKYPPGKAVPPPEALKGKGEGEGEG